LNTRNQYGDDVGSREYKKNIPFRKKIKKKKGGEIGETGREEREKKDTRQGPALPSQLT